MNSIPKKLTASDKELAALRLTFRLARTVNYRKNPDSAALRTFITVRPKLFENTHIRAQVKGVGGWVPIHTLEAV